MQWIFFLRSLNYCAACLAVQYFPTLSHEWYDFRRRGGCTEHKTRVFIFSTILSETFFILRTIQPDINTTVHRSLRKVPVILVIF